MAWHDKLCPKTASRGASPARAWRQHVFEKNLKKPIGLYFLSNTSYRAGA